MQVNPHYYTWQQGPGKTSVLLKYSVPHSSLGQVSNCDQPERRTSGGDLLHTAREGRKQETPSLQTGKEEEK